MNTISESQEEQKLIAMSILNQIGKDTLISLGASEFSYGSNTVKFKVATRHDFNKVLVKLNASDEYDIELWKVSVGEDAIFSKLIDEYHGVGCEELKGLFQRESIH